VTLNLRQRKFVAAYLISGNATDAAKKAGYSKQTAGAIGAENLKKPQIAVEIEKGRAQLAAKAGVTAERVVGELARIAFSDFRQFATWGPDGVRLAASSELTEEDARCIAEVSETITKDGGTVKFKLHDKKGALDSLAKHLGLFTDKVDITSGGRPLLGSERDARLEAILATLAERRRKG
jgi:phage terminase small subunit